VSARALQALGLSRKHARPRGRPRTKRGASRRPASQQLLCCKQRSAALVDTWRHTRARTGASREQRHPRERQYAPGEVCTTSLIQNRAMRAIAGSTHAPGRRWEATKQRGGYFHNPGFYFRPRATARQRLDLARPTHSAAPPRAARSPAPPRAASTAAPPAAAAGLKAQLRAAAGARSGHDLDAAGRQRVEALAAELSALGHDAPTAAAGETWVPLYNNSSGNSSGKISVGPLTIITDVEQVGAGTWGGAAVF
jgi:hypothetical protein